VEALRKRIREDREDLEARRELADILARSGEIELRREAFEALTDALLIDDSDPDLWVRMARLQERRGFRQASRRAYHRALAMAPNRSDLWNELAMHEFRRFQGHKRAEHLSRAWAANARSLAGDPKNVEALRRAVRMAYIVGDRKGVDSLCTVWEETWPQTAWPNLVRGMLHTETGAWHLARASFDRGLSRLSLAEARPFRRLDIVSPKQEGLRRNAADDSTRFLDDYWRWRDPTPADAVNPRLLEHYARMVQAELLFALDHMKVRGWEHAPGEMVVRYGIDGEWEYDQHVRRVEEYRVSPTFAAPTIEVTLGSPEEPLAFLFVDYNLSGRYYNPIEAFPRGADFFLVTDPSLYVPPFGVPELEHEVELWRFVDGTGSGRIEVAVALPPDIWPPGILDEPHRLASKLTLYEEDWEVVDAAVGSWAMFERDALGRLVARFELGGIPDSVIVGLETTDREAAGRAAGFAALSPLGPAEAPLLSDLAFLSAVTFEGAEGVYGRGYGAGLPNPGHRYRVGDPIGLAFEVYGLTTDGDGRCRSRLHITVGRQTRAGWLNVLLQRGQDPPEAELVFDASEPGSRLPQLLALDVPPLEPGEYELRVQVDDLQGGRSVTRSSAFTVLEPGKIR
jgi:GWxTD domain-containing protein